ncbi:3-phenylpropionate/cinnamic acid dioxygenase small subunit [Bacillus sp. SLBN-46]|nr:3-phenylpropionate/cinnamic acid dioxygenase small subunit [Bacillus sp. SLBN-46]
MNMVDTTEKMKIGELLSKSAYALDERKLEMLGECFSEDAIFTMRIAEGNLVGPFTGHGEIMNLMKDSMETQTDKRRHVVSNVFFEKVDSEHASVLSYLSLFATENGNIKLLTTGLYQDEVVKINHQWKIKKRHIDLELPY